MSYYLDDIIQLEEDFDLNNILIETKITWKYFDLWHFM